MIKVDELRELYKEYSQSGEEHSVLEFIDWVEKTQEERMDAKASVTSLKMREAKQRQKEIEQRQAENKPIDPEKDFEELPEESNPKIKK